MEACDDFWETCDEAIDSGDYKLHSKDKTRRARALAKHDKIFEVVKHCDRPLRQMARVVRSCEADRPSRNINASAVAAHLQPALDEGLMEQDHAQHLVNLAACGVEVKEWRDLEGKALDLSAGNTKLPEDEDILLDFYWEQTSLGRCIILPPSRMAQLDQLGELVLSPSFLVRADGKKPRAILHLSSTDRGVNQRLIDELEAHEDGYSTIKSISTEIVKTSVSMVLTPGKYHFDDICGTELSLIVMDADSAFFRCPAHEDIVGMQCARIKDHTVVLLCCSFGWKRSAEEFSHITAGIRAAYKSELGSATLVDKAAATTGEAKSELNKELTAFTQEKNPQHSHCIPGSHVDDYVCLEILRGNRPSASASDLAFAIKLFLGHNGPVFSVSFWSL